MDSGRIGSQVRIILLGNFHYSGRVLDEDELFLTILDKFSKRVSLRKSEIQVLEETG